MAKVPHLVKFMLISFLLFVLSLSVVLFPSHHYKNGTDNLAHVSTAVFILGAVIGLVLYTSFTLSLITSMINMGVWLKKGGRYFWLSVIVFFVTVAPLLYLLFPFAID